MPNQAKTRPDFSPPGKGQEMEFSAAEAAAMLKAGEAHRPGPKAVGGRGLKFGDGRDVMLCKNDTLVDRERFDTLGVAGVVYTDDDNALEFRKQPTLAGRTITVDDTCAFCVLLDFADAGRIVPAAVSGVTLAKVYIMDTTHTHAAPQIGEARLISTETGAVQILYRPEPEETGEQLCIVRIDACPDCADGCCRVFELSENPTLAAHDETHTYLDFGDASTTPAIHTGMIAAVHASGDVEILRDDHYIVNVKTHVYSTSSTARPPILILQSADSGATWQTVAGSLTALNKDTQSNPISTALGSHAVEAAAGDRLRVAVQAVSSLAAPATPWITSFHLQGLCCPQPQGSGSGGNGGSSTPPVTLAFDDFDRADSSNIGATCTIGPNGETITSYSWTETAVAAGNASIDNAELASTSPAAGNDVKAGIDPSAEKFAARALFDMNQETRFVFRADDPALANGWALHVDPSADVVALQTITAGTYADVATWPLTSTAGNTGHIFASFDEATDLLSFHVGITGGGDVTVMGHSLSPLYAGYTALGFHLDNRNAAPDRDSTIDEFCLQDKPGTDWPI